MSVPGVDGTGHKIETMDLVVFTTVVRTGSLGAAAAELRLSTPSVSVRIGALERKLGTALFVRGARGSTTTPAGERLLDYAQRCLDLLDEAAIGVSTHETQRLVLAAPASLGDVAFPAALQAVAGSAVTVHCRVAHSGEVVARLVDGSVHAGFVVPKVPLRGLRSEPISRSALVAVCRPDHPLADRRLLRIEDLCDTGVIVYRWGRDAQELAASLAHPDRGVDTPIHTTGLPPTAIRLAVDAGYVAVVPRFVAVRSVRDGDTVLLPLRFGDWRIDVQFVYASATADRLGVRTLLDNLPAIRAAFDED
ncbi:DNA-binding transcriptional LysR family regulator [Streptosporangium album]|uniref:DNA-binding transcriptional LysR family regulator n=1 Tax=Streptosporangium album TaxID=47479 RepID=A0A7W7S288_9ACTN|nr:LysR family transcriptional regulator [Streptosporangium album]MBB4941873.1 DNA-binding transcriptional LysR family regulator [Streptosporangium album]